MRCVAQDLGIEQGGRSFEEFAGLVVAAAEAVCWNLLPFWRGRWTLTREGWRKVPRSSRHATIWAGGDIKVAVQERGASISAAGIFGLVVAFVLAAIGELVFLLLAIGSFSRDVQSALVYAILFGACALAANVVGIFSAKQIPRTGAAPADAAVELRE